MIWEQNECLLMNPTDCTFNLVINKGALDCVMCSSDNIDRRMNTYRDKVGKVLSMVDLEDEDDNSNINEWGEDKGGATMAPSTAKNETRMKKNSRRRPRR